MEYQNTDDAIRRDACEKVKQIVKAIKAIKIKNYSKKFSLEDEEVYQNLQKALNKISNEHNLNNLKVALMQEVDARYNGENPENMKQGEQPEPNDILQACYGAVDAQKEALSKGRITQALRCQEKLKRYMQELDEKCQNEIVNYKREKFAELMQSHEQVEEQIKTWNNTMKSMYRIKHVKARREVMETIKGTQNIEKQSSIENEIENSTI